MKALILLTPMLFLSGCVEYKNYKDSLCKYTTLCEVVKEVKDAAKEAAKDASAEIIKEAAKGAIKK